MTLRKTQTFNFTLHVDCIIISTGSLHVDKVTLSPMMHNKFCYTYVMMPTYKKQKLLQPTKSVFICKCRLWCTEESTEVSFSCDKTLCLLNMVI